jgi:L-aspartate oxidase
MPASPPARQALRSLMWDDVGILRDGTGLARACARLAGWAAAPSGEGLEARETANLALVGWVMAEAARRREESRGAHHRLDFPKPRSAWRKRQRFVLAVAAHNGGAVPARAEARS